MSRIGASLRIVSSTFQTVRQAVDPLNAATTAADTATLATDQAAFETALATLVTDGASPTQAHVTAANSAYTTMQTDLAAVIADLGAAPAATDVVVSIDLSNCGSVGLLRKAFDRIVLALQGTSYLTP